ncbi:hypothetical protein GWK47_021936 [Chionoecetes opilio]|uniref:Uncharacterized protein n=1 Tax=Chionoecetes opilio TaxID=41210 RepID=A0A8J4XN94_CHIOP|nr:hypothetical protein GWK47_021936 [Chionoecetes opilio]
MSGPLDRKGVWEKPLRRRSALLWRKGPPGWGGAANKHLASDKDRGAVRAHSDTGRAGTTTSQPSHRRDVAGLTVIYKVHQPRCHSPAHTPAALTAGPVTTRAFALAPPELLQPRCRTWHRPASVSSASTSLCGMLSLPRIHALAVNNCARVQVTCDAWACRGEGKENHN